MTGRDTPTRLRDALLMYARLSSYQDEGSVSTDNPKLESRLRVTFETAFASPDLFRFKFSSPHPYPPLAHIVTTTICGQDGAGAYLWSRHYDNRAEIRNCESILMAVAAATGISSGSAHDIAQLLLPEIGGASFSDLEPIISAGEQVVAGRTCEVFRGRIPGADAELTLFVDRETLVIPRIDTRFAQFSSQEMRRNIRLNESIDSSTFARPKVEI
jgi:hypothetical protein